MRFLANENFPLASVDLLRKQGYEVVAIAEESPGMKDKAILQRAHNEKRVLITFDRDYGELIFKLNYPAPEGVLYLRFDPVTPEEPAIHVLNLLKLDDLTFGNKFTVSDRSQTRQRPLP